MKKKVLKPKVVGNRGKAIPLGDNFYYMQGPKHSEGGIPIGKNPKTGIEVEGEEVMHISPKEVKVFSSVPFLNGESPAEKVLGGEEPNKVFKQQENFKDRNKIKDDGTKKKALGGDIKQTLNKVNSSKADFVKRLKDGNRTSITDWADENSIATHKLGVGTDAKGNNYIYPEVQNIKGKLVDFTRPPYKDTAGRQSAEERRDTVRVNSINEGVEFTKKYKDHYPNFNKKKAMGGLSRNNISRSKFKDGGKPNSKKKEDYLPSTGELTRDNQLVTARAAEIGRVTTPNHYKLADTGDRKPTKIEHTTGDKIKSFAVRTLSEAGPNALSDIAGTGANVIGAIKGYKTNKKMLSKLKYSNAPTPRQAAKLKTKININPQLDKMRESVAAYERDVNANTASSRVGLQRKQLARIAGMLQTNELYGNKENMETQLINKDKLNQQAVADRNVTEYNQWARGKADFNNNIANLKAENKVSYLNNLANSVQDLIARGDLRRKEDLDRKLIGLANPHGEAVVDGNEVFKRGSKKKK